MFRPKERKCKDNKKYKNPLTQQSCTSNKHLNCTLWSSYGLTMEQTNELIFNCPVSCGLCP